MSQLYEDYRPTSWSDVVGQGKIIAKMTRPRSRGLTGRPRFASSVAM